MSFCLLLVICNVVDVIGLYWGFKRPVIGQVFGINKYAYEVYKYQYVKLLF